jgi:DNA-binding Lrp family transcriptional regulator
MVTGKNNHEIADFVSQKLSHIDGVKETITQFILKRYKEDGEVMEAEEVMKRQAVVL